MPRSLPERPDLENLKTQAKSLLRAAREGDTAAVSRFTILPAFGNRPPAQWPVTDLALHDAQSVLAREHGFVSWNAMREEVEARTLTFDAAKDEFVRCATGGASGRAERILALHPRIATASLQTAIVLGDAATVSARLQAHSELATQPGGPQEWEPLLYACHTCLCGRDASRLDGLVAIARQLCILGANPNGEYHWNWHPELPRTVLWGALCAVSHLPLAEVLLEAGANPTDGVSAHITGGGGNIAALELLHRYGLCADGIAGAVPPLLHMMLWATNPTGPRWLLEHGADANLSWGLDGEAPLHVAARRWDVAMVDILLNHGADLHRRRKDGRTAHALAELHGNRDIAQHLLATGAHDELSALDRFVAACARGDRHDAAAMLVAQPSLRGQLRPDHHLLLHRPAESGDSAALETMLASGFDPDARDQDNVTPLHRAAMGGHPDAVRVLLAHGADIGALDGMFAASPLVWAVEGRDHASPGSDHVAVARILIDAGCSLDWQPPPGAPDQERTFERLIDLRRAALESA
ncbi:ankyrin repeat protein [Luteitalea pratensis]|uniref:Ankyrin repeat protein n=1 Tax=Luteitalea pratensis TaxID=1855912 RepID=A0A143PES5_LUTPR|nr:ankyrin repeat domain-containing protein [Luteitalea pratensis]AMY07047.1 ankyrin repeat protein [Luteitalea pratensis]